MVRKSRFFALCSSLAFAGAFLALTACGSDSSSSSKGESVNVFDSEDDLPECSDSLGLDSAYVGADSSLYVCADGKWTAADSASSDSSGTEKSSSSSTKNSSESKDDSSSSESASSSSKGASSSSDAPGTETLYVCEDHVNDISLKLYNDTLNFRYLEPAYRGPWISVDKAEEQIALNYFFEDAADEASKYKSYSRDELCDVSASLCALAAVDSAWEVVYDSSLRIGFSFRLPDTERNRELVQSFRIEYANVEASAFDNSDCVGGDVSYCRNDPMRNMDISYKYPEDTLVIGSHDLRLDFPYEDVVSAYNEYFSLLFQNIEKAAEQGDDETLASLMGVEKDSPWMDLFKDGVRISVILREYPSRAEINLEMAVKGYDKKELAEAILRAECSSSEDFWAKRLFDSNLFVDARDNQTYRTVQIGEQTWMAENLNYAYTLGTANLDSSSFCYDNDPANCETYGRLYTWSAAMDSAAVFSAGGKDCGYGVTCSASGKVRGVCPDGWHLPDTTEWNKLASYVASKTSDGVGYALKSTTGWNNGSENGSDAFGFGLLPAGMGAQGGSNFGGVFESTYFWSSTEKDTERSNVTTLYNELDFSYASRKLSVLSIRCVKD